MMPQLLAALVILAAASPAHARTFVQYEPLTGRITSVVQGDEAPSVPFYKQIEIEDGADVSGKRVDILTRQLEDRPTRIENGKSVYDDVPPDETPPPVVSELDGGSHE